MTHFIFTKKEDAVGQELSAEQLALVGGASQDSFCNGVTCSASGCRVDRVNEGDQEPF